jgi:hypothetical protein
MSPLLNDLLTQNLRSPRNLQRQRIELIDTRFDAPGGAIDVLLDLIDHVVDSIDLVFEVGHGVHLLRRSTSSKEGAEQAAKVAPFTARA